MEKIINDKCREEIRELIVSSINRINEKRFIKEPWIKERELINSPFNTRLVPDTIWRASKYERSYVTSFGSIYEKISEIVAQNYWSEVKLQHSSFLTIYQSQRDHISVILDELDHKKKKGDPNRREPNWDNETKELLSLNSGPKVELEVNSDLYLFDGESNTKSFLEIKSPKPNKDQTKVSKEKMMKLFCGFHNSPERIDIFYSLPFNPWGKRNDYAHSFPFTYFQMKTSSVVNMGKGYWDYLGKKEGTYEALLELMEEIGRDTKKSIEPHL